jgi:hypothetical protein
MDNTIMAAHAESDRFRHSREVERQRHMSESQANHKIQKAVQKVLHSTASDEVKVAAIQALMGDDQN